jgi:hypothetical protein
MQNMKNNHLFYFIILIFFTGCGKKINSISLPPITQEGLNTFGCYIDGKGFINQTCGCFNPDGYNIVFRLGYQNQSPYSFSLCASDKYNYPFRYFNFKGTGKKLQTGDKISFASPLTPNSIWVEYIVEGIQLNNGYFGSEYFITKPPISGEMNLVLVDTVNRIISGTFQFSAIDTINNVNVSITSGRFDGKY